jgi:bacterioferritin-associated ferredoxin
MGFQPVARVWETTGWKPIVRLSPAHARYIPRRVSPKESPPLMELDDTVCHCFHITKRKVFNFIRVERPRVPSQIANCGGAGTGCGWCVAYLRRYFAEAAASQPTSSTKPTHIPPEVSLADAPEITADEYALRRAGYIRAGKGTPAPGAVPLPPAG